MPVKIRAMTKGDLERCGSICYEAFKSIADQHQFRPDFPSPEAGIQEVASHVSLRAWRRRGWQDRGI